MPQNFLKYVFKKVFNKYRMGTYTKKGKNFSGKICVFHRGGGNKKIYRVIDFWFRVNSFGYLCGINYDPYRTGFVGLILFDNGFFSNVLLADGVKVGEKLFFNFFEESYWQRKGSVMPLRRGQLFSIVSNFEARPSFGTSVARSAGTGAILVSVLSNVVVLKLRSGWFFHLPKECLCTIGYVSNSLHNRRVLRKAGKNRWLGKRPVVRGVAMNPVDHPHGGGNGKTSPTVTPFSPWGKFTKWTPTKNKKKDRLRRRLFKELVR